MNLTCLDHAVLLHAIHGRALDLDYGNETINALMLSHSFFGDKRKAGFYLLGSAKRSGVVFDQLLKRTVNFPYFLCKLPETNHILINELLFFLENQGLHNFYSLPNLTFP